MYWCTAKLKIEEENGCDHYMINRDHSKVFQLNNGIQPENADGLDDKHDTKFEVISGQYNKR